MMGDEEAEIPFQNANDANNGEDPTRAEYFRIFEKADIDGDGYITTTELAEMIRRNNLTDAPLKDSEIRSIHKIADTNYDGRLDFDEFVHMIQNPNFQHIFGRYVTRYVNFIVPRAREHFYEDEYSCWPPHLGMFVISLIEFIFALVDQFNMMHLGPIAEIFIYNPQKRCELWRFLTYMFVHVGYFHLAVNLVFQIFVGIPLEMVHGWWRVLLVYFLGVIAGSLGTSITDPKATIAGASGGVYSLFAAHLATTIMNWEEMQFRYVYLVIFSLVPIFDIGTSIYDRYCAENSEPIAYIAHFFGAAAGLLVGILVLRNLKLVWHENIIWWISCTIFVIFVFVAILCNIFVYF